MLANKPGASLGLEHLGPTASAISSRNWSSWLREKFVPEEGSVNVLRYSGLEGGIGGAGA